MKNFTVGPVMMDKETLLQGQQQIPYFRTKEFSQIMKENESLMCKFVQAEQNAKCLFITGSGTASMEASIINCFTSKDKLLIVNGGTFGQRLCQICKIHNLNYTEIKLQPGQTLTRQHLAPFDKKDFTGLLMQHHETSTGVLYDISMVGDFCYRNKLFFLLDCISSFCAEHIYMQTNHINLIITGSQKAIALPPGISTILLDTKAIERIQLNQPESLYFDLKDYLKNSERGQTPFTPAVSILLQMNEKLHRIDQSGGIEQEISKVHNLATYFRTKSSFLPFRLLAETPSAAVSALKVPSNIDAYHIFEILKDKYNIFVCPNGGELSHEVFRVGHIGAITQQDTDELIEALKNIIQKQEVNS